ncbi:4-(cytidine 5'-diphospho)-2-C-methyl-D-erythritol kinase [Berryella wangjianweii]|uniref:4-diphosphocytidyl-2-C-methyl-D-erythritol kinase n=1 Tax=Berryella wangjianweii TaxID=2734634 RepID=A0A6M8J1T0_9ACTN|nr:4-(cytidine 5'-diphospho)-2-C-methyl-D-erythritol kinase [Berryella wangjianweii]QKF07514.1 4-(cytidine 5'-diphospho)-2-C-methyl-D-erythritol kinase [Berryella wangjianweii]
MSCEGSQQENRASAVGRADGAAALDGPRLRADADAGRVDAAAERPLVDLFAEARSVQCDDRLATGGWLRLAAPAKVNLHLEVGAADHRGFHHVDTVLHALALHDVLSMRLRPAKPGAGLQLAVSARGRGDVQAPDVPGSQNIAHRAVETLARLLGRTHDELIELVIDKHVPAQAGLGGGSSDAAAALVGAARLWGIDPECPEVMEAARQLGSDVPFFLVGGAALFTGRGERLVRALRPRRGIVALVKPAGGVPTAQAYRAFDRLAAAGGGAPAPAGGLLQRAVGAEEVPLFNSLAPASEQVLPELAEVRAWIGAQPGVREALLCGSGACTFAVCDSSEACLRLVGQAKARGWWARATSFAPLRAAVVG